MDLFLAFSYEVCWKRKDGPLVGSGLLQCRSGSETYIHEWYLINTINQPQQKVTRIPHYDWLIIYRVLYLYPVNTTYLVL